MDTRPTSDKLRETLFNVLVAGKPDALSGSTWLDLYAGTGAVGIEALSRGAHHVTFVDISRAAAKVIRDNVEELSLTDSVEVLVQDASVAIRELTTRSFQADYIFVDPPYSRHEQYQKTLESLSQSGILKDGSVIIAEHDKRYDPGEIVGGLQRYRKMLQGDSGLSFYRKV
jgi:16S rRNA (guanine(966)-N(2))-methyltransferase RsmD